MTDLNNTPENYCLTTAEILYHLPDYPQILQLYIWQEYDYAPRYPALKKFLDFWQQNMEGKMHSIVVGHTKIIQPPVLFVAQTSLMIH